MEPRNKWERALGEVYDLLIKAEPSANPEISGLLHRAIERCKYWKQPEFDSRFLEPEKHPRDCTCESEQCAAKVGPPHDWTPQRELRRGSTQVCHRCGLMRSWDGAEWHHAERDAPWQSWGDVQARACRWVP